MFVEGHWKVIKRDFLYKFFRPRLDLVVYVLLTKVILHQQRKLEQIQSGRERPEWIKKFKSEWKKLSTHKINNIYITDVEKWVCECSYYLTSRFNICKHLIHQKGPVKPEYFECLQRNHKPPFLTKIDKNSTQLYVDSIPTMHSNPENPETHHDLENLYQKVVILFMIN